MAKHAGRFSLSVHRIGALVREFIAEHYPEDVYVYDDTWLSLAWSGDVEEVKVRIQSHFAAPDDLPRAHRTYAYDDVIAASWHALNVMCHFHDKARRISKEMGRTAVTELLEQAILETDTPKWLGGRLLNSMPRLLMRSETVEAEDSDISRSGRPYVVFCGNELPEDCGVAELEKYRVLVRKNQFEIVIDDIGVSKQVLIGGRPGLIRPGDGYPYRIIRYLLTRVGRDVTYREIRRQLWTDGEIKTQKNLSRTIRDRLEHIRSQARSQCDSLESDPEEWFRKTTAPGVIHVWEGLNSCLMTTKSSLRPKSI